MNFISHKLQNFQSLLKRKTWKWCRREREIEVARVQLWSLCGITHTQAQFDQHHDYYSSSKEAAIAVLMATEAILSLLARQAKGIMA